MQDGPPTLGPDEQAEYFRELKAQQLRAKQLFNCYLVDEEPQDADDDYYVAYYEEDVR